MAKRKDVSNLTGVSNNAGFEDSGLDKLLRTQQLGKVIASYPGGCVLLLSCTTSSYPCSNKRFESLYLKGEISLELVPQGTLAERIRAHAAGIPAFYTPTGADTAVEEGSIPMRYNPGGASKGVQIQGIAKESRTFGKKYVLETAIEGDVAFVHAWKVDEVGNCVFRYASQNFSAVMAKNAKMTIVEVKNILLFLYMSSHFTGRTDCSHWQNFPERDPPSWYLY